MLVLAAGALPAGARGDRPLAVGELAPPLALGDQHGRPFRLADLLDRRNFVVVAFYVKAFTGGWDLEFSRFREDQPRLAALNAELVGVSADARERVLAWTRALRLPFRLLSDPDGAAARRWGAWDDTWRLARRVTYIVDARGRIRWADEGGVAIDTSRTLDALERLARER